MFPELYDKESRSKGSTATYISTILKDLMPTKNNENKVVASLLWDNEVTGTSLRRGAARIMVRKIDLQAVVAKTGHDMRGSRESSVWEYIDGDDYLLGQGSAALAGWEHPENPVYPPTLKHVLNEGNAIKFENLCSLLFDHRFPTTKVENIKGLVKTMLATFIMYLSEFNNDCIRTYNTVSGQQNCILILFQEKIKGIFTLEECLEFGKLIRDEWEQRNNTSSVNSNDGFQLSIERLQTECLKIRSENRDLRSQVATIKDEIQRTNKLVSNLDMKVSTMLDLLSNRGGNTSVPSPVKPSGKRLFLEECSSSPLPNKRVRNEDIFTQACSSTPLLNKRVRNEDTSSQASDEFTERESSAQGTFVHQFGMDNNKVVTQITLSELLLLSFSKGLMFNVAEKGKCTYQNFQCFSGNPPVMLRADEARVRSALTLLHKHIDNARKVALSKRRPKENVPEWNQQRNKIALEVQEKVIDELSREEFITANKLKVKVPKCSASTISTVIGRYDRLALDKRVIANANQKTSLTAFLSGPTSSSSSSSSSDFV